ncbi:MAG: AAA domain-containing protein [Nitriliruptorales bacterium]|nr:AAA domain-containing protein [Nitriliruptorales bacterium]
MSAATTKEPFYIPQADEVDIFRAAYLSRTPVLLKGPTGCGKTRFLEYMAWNLADEDDGPLRLETVSCNDDLTVGDLVGRYVLEDGGTTWMDGPLLSVAKTGGICYLDEIVEARKDTMVVIHSLTDHRRLLPVTRLGTTFEAHEHFQLVVSYNPGYQSTVKDLKDSTRQRFVAIELDFPPEDVEIQVIVHEAGVERDIAERLCLVARKIRSIQEDMMVEGPSSRVLIHTGRLIQNNVPARKACNAAIALAISDDPEVHAAVRELTNAVFASDD